MMCHMKGNFGLT